MREPATQDCPVLLKIAAAASRTASSSGASAKTMVADFPPNSSETRLVVPAARREMSWAARGEPVKETPAMPGCSTSAAPASGPNPWTAL